MILEPKAAEQFIFWYQALLLEIENANSPDFDPARNVLEVMLSARFRMCETPALLDHAVARLSARLGQMNEDVATAMKTLSLDDWIYLRDTKTCSIFMDVEGKHAYGVLGLTERIRDVCGGSGALISAGLVQFAGRIVCDGLITRVAELGSGYRKTYANAYRDARAEGRFYINAVLTNKD